MRKLHLIWGVPLVLALLAVGIAAVAVACLFIWPGLLLARRLKLDVIPDEEPA